MIFNLNQLVDVSLSALPFVGMQREALFRQSRVANDRIRPAGVLFHLDGSFFQVFEGAVGGDEVLYAEIQVGPLQKHVTQIIREPICRRSVGASAVGIASLKRDALAPDRWA